MARKPDPVKTQRILSEGLALMGLSMDELAPIHRADGQGAADKAMEKFRVKCREAYRSALKRHHPDKGGSEEAMKTLNLCMEVVEVLRVKALPKTVRGASASWRAVDEASADFWSRRRRPKSAGVNVRFRNFDHQPDSNIDFERLEQLLRQKMAMDFKMPHIQFHPRMDGDSRRNDDLVDSLAKLRESMEKSKK